MPDAQQKEAEHVVYRDSAILAWETLRAYARSKNIQTPLFNIGRKVCVGVITMQRKTSLDRRYLTGTVTSVITRLDWTKDYNDISLVILDMETDPNDNAEAIELGEIFDLQRPPPLTGVTLPSDSDVFARRDIILAKETADYARALTYMDLLQCENVVLLEDDALASCGWYESVCIALRTIPYSLKSSWLVMKLMTSYKYFFWDTAKIFFLHVLCAASAFQIQLLLIGKGSRIFRSNNVFCMMGRVGVWLLLWLWLWLVKMADILGPLHFLPLPFRRPFPLTYHFNTTACLFPGERVPLLIQLFKKYLSHLHDRGDYRAKDSLLTTFVQETGLAQLVYLPSIFEHCGIHTSLAFKANWDWKDMIGGAFFEDAGVPIVFQEPSQT